MYLYFTYLYFLHIFVFDDDNFVVITLAASETTISTEVHVDKAASNTVFLVLVLIIGVAMIFICFAMAAVCYRYSDVASCSKLSFVWMKKLFMNSMHTKYWMMKMYFCIMCDVLPACTVQIHLLLVVLPACVFVIPVVITSYNDNSLYFL